MKKIIILVITTITFIGCAKDSFNTNINNYPPPTTTTPPSQGGGKGDPQVPLTLMNIQMGAITLWTRDTNRHATSPIQNRRILRTKRMQPLAIKWETSQSVRANMIAEVRDLQYNQTLISNASVTDSYGENGSAYFSPEIRPGTYIISITLTLIDPGNTNYSQTYEFIYPLCIEQ